MHEIYKREPVTHKLYAVHEPDFHSHCWSFMEVDTPLICNLHFKNDHKVVKKKQCFIIYKTDTGQ